MSQGLVSIIMPVWNGEVWIAAAIESVQSQSYTHWELIIIDNGSEDQSGAIARSYKDDRIQVLSTDHSGVSKARNLGLEKANGAFICFLDCDDRLPSKSIESRIEHLTENRNVAFVDGIVRRYNDDFSDVIDDWRSAFRGDPLPSLLRLNGDCFRGITWMFRREDLGDLRFKEDLSHSEDLVFFAELAANGGNYTSVNEPTYDIRIRKDSAMSDLNGLADGYDKAFQYFKGFTNKVLWRDEYRAKVRRILFRSFLKRGQIIPALRSWFNWS